MATSILNTLLFNQTLNDVLVWKAVKNGLYYVWSAYRCVHVRCWEFGWYDPFDMLGVLAQHLAIKSFILRWKT